MAPTVAMAGAVGRDANAAAATSLLRAAGVDLTRVAETDLPTGTAAICVDPAGENQIAVAAGANTQAHAGQVSDADLGPGTTVLLQNEIGPAQSLALAARAHRLGARVILNLAPAHSVDAEVLKYLHWLVVNEDEAQAVAAQLGFARDFIKAGPLLRPAVVCTLGGRGVEWSMAGQYRHEIAHPVTVADTTAAGDCFTGVFAAALDRNQPPSTAIRRANRAAALCCTRPGSQSSLPTSAEINAP